MGKMLSESSLDSYKIRGDDDESEIEKDGSPATPARIKFEKDHENDELEEDGKD